MTVIIIIIILSLTRHIMRSDTDASTIQ